MMLPALLIPTLLGLLVVALLLREDTGTGLLERLCLSYPLGMGLLSLQLFLLGLMRVPLTLMNSSLPLVVEIFLLLVCVYRFKITIVPIPSFPLLDELRAPNIHAINKVALVLLLAWITVKLASVFYFTWLRPIYAWDAWVNWSTGAKLFYYTKGLMLDAPAQDFFARGAVGRIISYPLHSPLLQVWISLWTGNFDEVLVKLWSPLYLLALTVYLSLFMTREIGRLAGTALIVVFLGSPFLAYHAMEAYSDLPLAAYFLFATASFVQAMRGRRAYWPLAGLFAAQALFTKDEALFYIAPLIASAALFLWRSSEPSTRRNQLAMLLIPLVCALPWYVFKLSHHLGIGAEHVQIELVFHPEILWLALQQVLSLDNFNVFFLFAPVLLLVGGKPDREVMYLVPVVVCFFSFFLSLYAVINFFFDHFSKGTVFFRNLLTFYPVTALITVLLLKKVKFVPAPVVRRSKKSRR